MPACKTFADAKFDEESGAAMGIDAWWPQLVGDEPALKDADIYTFSYPHRSVFRQLQHQRRCRPSEGEHARRRRVQGLVEDGWTESTSSSFEKVMATLALLVLAPARYGELEAGLRRDLSDSHRFWQPARTDIVDVLEGLGVEAASRLASAWKPFYAGYGSRA